MNNSQDKIAKKLKKIAKIASGIIATAGVIYLATRSNDDTELSYSSLGNEDIDNNEYPLCDCGTKMVEFDGWAWYTCPSCGNGVRDNHDGIWSWQNEIFGNNSYSSNKQCGNCQQSLSGGSYTTPWENGNNPDGYIKCPHCRYLNFQYED